MGYGDNQKPKVILESALIAPLAQFDVKGAKGCLLQIDGGTDMTISQVDELANMFTKALDEDAQVILGARITPELTGKLRVVCVLSGYKLRATSRHCPQFLTNFGFSHLNDVCRLEILWWFFATQARITLQYRVLLQLPC